MRRIRPWAWVSITAFGLLLLAAFAVQHSIRRDLKAWEDYRASAAGRGESFGTDPRMAPTLPDEENFAAHPWMEGFNDGDSDEARAMSELEWWWDDFQPDYRPPQQGFSWFHEHPAAAARLMERFELDRRHFTALRDAARRPSCRLPFDLSEGILSTGEGNWMNLGGVARLMLARVDACLVIGRHGEAVEDLVTLHRIARHLRLQNLWISTIVGVGIESQAAPHLQLAEQVGALDGSARERLRAAFRVRPLNEELHEVLRAEKVLVLRSFETLSVGYRPESALERLQALAYPKKRLVAANALAFCELVDPILREVPGDADWRDFADRVDELRDEPDHPSNRFAVQILVITARIPEGIVNAEEDMQATRAAIGL